MPFSDKADICLSNTLSVPAPDCQSAISLHAGRLPHAYLGAIRPRLPFRCANPTRPECLHRSADAAAGSLFAVTASSVTSGVTHHGANSFCKLLEALFCSLELFLSSTGKPVVLRPPVCLSDAPFRRDPIHSPPCGEGRDKWSLPLLGAARQTPAVYAGLCRSRADVVLCERVLSTKRSRLP